MDQAVTRAATAVVRCDEVEVRQPARPTTRVAVVVSLNFPDLTEPVAELVRRFTRTALRTLGNLGAGWELLDTSTPLPAFDAGGFDGLLLLGGGDIDGSLYGVAGPVPNSYGVDRAADDYAIAAIRAAAAAELPVLGICRGAQLLNVAHGGTLVPDLVDYRLHRGGPGRPMFLDEQVTVLGGTRLASVLGDGPLVVRSGHHQAVAVPGAGLAVAARAADGVIEAIEHKSAWLVGVQWHPEDSDGDAAHRMVLFEGFLHACRQSVSCAR